MNKQDLKAQVMIAIDQTWPRFQEEHPALAQVIDQTMLSEHVVESLAEDEAFRDAYETAVAVEAGARVMSDLVSRSVAAVLGRLR